MVRMVKLLVAMSPVSRFLSGAGAIMILGAICLIMLYSLSQAQTAPRILSASPGQNELNVPNSTNTSATFDADMDGATIMDSIFGRPAGSSGPYQRTTTYTMPDSAKASSFFSPNSGDSLNVSCVGRWPFGSSYAVEVQDDLVYLGSGGGIYVLDISDPTSPMVVTEFATPGLVRGLFLDVYQREHFGLLWGQV